MKKMATTLVALMAGIALLNPAYGFSFGSSKGNDAFSPAQKQEIQQVVHDYLVNNPEVLVEVSQSLQAKEMAKAKGQAVEGINKNKQKLFNNSQSPVAGNADGAVTLVEFFDYQCGHCKEMQPVIEKVLGNNNVKIIYKEFPIFGDASNRAAQMALAAAKQNKYKEFHNALMKSPGALNPAKLQEIAKSVGLNVEKLNKDMNDPAIKQELSDNYDLAKALNLAGTPAFILSNKNLTEFDFIPGAAPEQMFQQSVDNIAKK